MRDYAPTEPRENGDNIIVHIDPAFEPLVPRFLANRKKEVAAMYEALAQQNLRPPLGSLMA